MPGCPGRSPCSGGRSSSASLSRCSPESGGAASTSSWMWASRSASAQQAEGELPLPCWAGGRAAGGSALVSATVSTDRCLVAVPPRLVRRLVPIIRSYTRLRNARNRCAGMADDTAQYGTLETEENSVTCPIRPLPAITRNDSTSSCVGNECQSIRLNTQPGEMSPETRVSGSQISGASAPRPRCPACLRSPYKLAGRAGQVLLAPALGYSVSATWHCSRCPGWHGPSLDHVLFGRLTTGSETTGSKMWAKPGLMY